MQSYKGIDCITLASDVAGQLVLVVLVVLVDLYPFQCSFVRCSIRYTRHGETACFSKQDQDLLDPGPSFVRRTPPMTTTTAAVFFAAIGYGLRGTWAPSVSEACWLAGLRTRAKSKRPRDGMAAVRMREGE